MIMASLDPLQIRHTTNLARVMIARRAYLAQLHLFGIKQTHDQNFWMVIVKVHVKEISAVAVYSSEPGHCSPGSHSSIYQSLKCLLRLPFKYVKLAVCHHSLLH